MNHKPADPHAFPQEFLEPSQGFYNLGIAPKILDILEQIHFKVPTPIQLKAIPLAIEGKDVIGELRVGDVIETIEIENAD